MQTEKSYGHTESVGLTAPGSGGTLSNLSIRGGFMIRRTRFRLRPAMVAVLAVALATAGLLVSGSASVAAPEKPTQLAVLSVTDEGTGLGQPVKNKPFDVVVQSQVAGGIPTAVTKDTTVKLSVETPGGSLSGVVTAVIQSGDTTATIAGAIYSVFKNDVLLQVSATKGERLTSGTRLVNVQAVAAAKSARPRDPDSLTLSECADTTRDLPTCATLLLPNGANGPVFLSEGSCAGIVGCRIAGGGIESLLVDARFNLKDENGVSLYTRSRPATLIIECDKSLCVGGGVPNPGLLVDIDGDGPFEAAPSCPAKGVISEVDPRPFCVDHRQSHRESAGDLLTYLLFAIDVRTSHP